MSFFKETAERYESELLNSIIPFWEQHSIDSEYGGFLTCLERDGTVYDTNKYMWMQWREVYLFAALYNSAFSQKRYLEYADNGFDWRIFTRRTVRCSAIMCWRRICRQMMRRNWKHTYGR